MLCVDGILHLWVGFDLMSPGYFWGLLLLWVWLLILLGYDLWIGWLFVGWVLLTVMFGCC